MKKITFLIALTLLNIEGQPIFSIFKLIPPLLLFIYILNNLYFKKLKLEFKLPMVIKILLIIITIGILRDHNLRSSFFMDLYRFINFILILIVYLQYLNLSYKDQSLNRIFTSIIYSPFLILILINLIFYLILNSNSFGANLGTSVLLSNFGIFVNRANFLFSPGNNAYSSIVGFILVISLYELIYLKKIKIIFFLGLFLSVVTLLLADTRSAFIYPFIIFIPLFIMLKKIKGLPFIKVLPFLIVIGPLLILIVMNWLASVPELQFLQRTQTDFETGNARLLIWAYSLQEFMHFKLIHLIGYGEYGQYISGASANWAFLFTAWDDPELTTSHSILFTILFDYGYVGLIFIIIYQFNILLTIKRNWKTQKSINVILLSFFVYWNLIGFTEAFFGFYGRNTMKLFMFISIFVYFVDFVTQKKLFYLKERNELLL